MQGAPSAHPENLPQARAVGIRCCLGSSTPDDVDGRCATVKSVLPTAPATWRDIYRGHERAASDVAKMSYRLVSKSYRLTVRRLSWGLIVSSMLLVGNLADCGGRLATECSPSYDPVPSYGNMCEVCPVACEDVAPDAYGCYFVPCED